MLVPVYDIINCGPRHRFWANGKIVHNSAKLNQQNLQRGSKLRDAIQAPAGMSLGVCDLSGIEMSVLAWMAGQNDVLDTVRSGGDAYCNMATALYGRRVTKENKKERQLGKTIVLGAGFSMGWRKFAEYTEAMGMKFTMQDCETMGIDFNRYVYQTKDTDIDPQKAVAWHAINTYRATNWAIANFWRDCGNALADIKAGVVRRVGEPDVCYTSSEGFTTPDNGVILYPGLRLEGRDWVRDTREGVSFLSPGLVAENIVQHVSRQILAWQMLKAVSEGLNVVHTCHDEIVILHSEDEIEEAYQRLEGIMCTNPPWADGLPLAAEGGVAKSYGEAK